MAYLEVRTQKIGCVNHDCDECKAKAQRTWVGLTDEERGQVYASWRFHPSNGTNLHLCKAIEAKLKEKNT